MKKLTLKGIVVLCLFALLASCGNSNSATTDTQASLPIPNLDPTDTATVVVNSANSMAQVGAGSAPAFNFLTKPADDIFLYAITGFTFDSTSGTWTGTTQNGATPSIKFYKDSDESLITVDITDSANYFPGGDLLGLNPPGQDNTNILIEVTVAVSTTLTGDYTFEATVNTGKLATTDANTDTSATYSYTGSSGTITGDFGTMNLTDIELTASELGAQVEGTYSFTVTVEDETITGTASFDENGCNGATLNDGDGNLLGTAEINDEGALIFTDASTGEATEIERLN